MDAKQLNCRGHTHSDFVVSALHALSRKLATVSLL